MEELNVCTLRTAESVVQITVTGPPNAASVIDADKLINSKTVSTLVKGEKRDEELLKGLLTDTYCHVCTSQLTFESHRLSHYEGKKHAQKVKIFLETVRAEKNSRYQTLTSDKNRFCELCNMVFSSNVVAKSHYEGKVHAKNLRKQSLRPPVRDAEDHTSSSMTQNPEMSEQKSTQVGDVELQMDPTASPASTSTEVDLKDPNKYCSLCAASFNNPQMALQHYNGRKHQRKQSRMELLRKLGDDAEDSSLMCHMCGVTLNSVEMYQAHMQGNKHQIKEKKISDLFKTQPKVYSSFTDELADYIRVQKARGVTPKTGPALPQDGTQKGDADEEVVQDGLTEWNLMKTSESMCDLPQNHQPPHQLIPGHPSYPGPPWPTRGWDYNCPLPLQHSAFTQFPSRSTKSERHRTLSSSSTYTSSSYASDSSYMSDSDASEYRHRAKRRKRKTKGDGGKEGGGELDTKERRKKQQRRERDSEEKRREPSVESEEEGSGKKIKSHKRQRQEKTYQQENFGTERAESQTELMMEKRNEIQLPLQTKTNPDQSEKHNKLSKSKYAKEKKKGKEKADLRTEEEKLWDDSILGC